MSRTDEWDPGFVEVLKILGTLLLIAGMFWLVYATNIWWERQRAGILADELAKRGVTQEQRR